MSVPRVSSSTRLSVQHATRSSESPRRAQVSRWVAAAARGVAELTIRFVNAAEGRALNRQYRGRDYATNVLSFAYAAPPAAVGDVVLCVPVVLREAAEQGKQAEAHFAHLVVHGILHLLGYDHEHMHDAQAMESREREILASLGYADPYAARS